MNGQKFPLWLLSILMALALLLPAAAQPASGQPGAVAALDPLQGLIQVRGADAPEDAWETITRVRLVAEGEWVRTDHVGEAVLTFFEGNETTILPNTLIKVAKFDIDVNGASMVTIEQPVGDTVHEIDPNLSPKPQYEVYTPSAVITVRGTNFWANGTPLSATNINLYDGILETKGIDPSATIGSPVFISAGQSLLISDLGQPGVPQNQVQPPPDPPPAPLAPATCGNGTCETDEQQNNSCALDCQTFPGCGDGQCDLAGLEGPVTCPADCVPAMRVTTTEDGGTADEPQPTGIPCTVSTATYVDLRVGPGFNRGVRGSVPLNIDIPVIGKYTDAQAFLWWKIQPPGYLPAEADRYWVLESDVTEAGDCALVPDAPPSGVVAPPPPAQPTAAPGITPSPGMTPVTPVSISFYADRYVIDYYLDKDPCATIYWDVEGIDRVYFEGNGVVGHSSQKVCPRQTTTYTLLVYLLDGTSTTRTVTIVVDFSSG